MTDVDIGTGEDEEQVPQRKPFLPVLIIPGFMSSGLYVKESGAKPSWEDKRIWLNLGSLGFQAMHFGGDMRLASASPSNDTVKKDEGYEMRSLWLQHMALKQDMKTEKDGIQVRNITGLAGVDYLTPGALTSHVSYVFGPVIQALQAVGYVEGQNLDASPYDWRVPPHVLEDRDQYFSRTMVQVVDLYEKNKNTPVVLLGHSLGTKTAHYFLNFAKEKAGRGWIDKYVHTYMPVGAPHLGAPKALRSIVSGDKMGLETFLSSAEALVMGRSFGSGPFLLPKEMPPDATSTVFIRNDGSIEVAISTNIDTEVFLKDRIQGHKPSKVKLIISFDGTSVSMPFVPINQDGTVKFEGTFIFRTPSNGPTPDSTLAVLLCEPGLGRARKSQRTIRGTNEPRRTIWSGWADCWRNKFKCYNICCFFCIILSLTAKTLLYIIYWVACKSAMFTADELSKAAGGSSVVAAGKMSQIRRCVGSGENGVAFEVDLVSERDGKRWFGRKRKTTVTANVKWIPPSKSTQYKNDKCSYLCQQPKLGRVLPEIKNKKKGWGKYEARPGYDILALERCHPVMESVRNDYDNDSLDPRKRCASDAPPVRRVKAIYGINLPTEVGAVYKRVKGVVERPDKVLNLFTLDTGARLESRVVDGYIIEGGIVKETDETKQLVKKPTGNDGSKSQYVSVCGDGTVPYWSLQHARTWASDCDVSIVEIDKAEHREILADKRFHEVLCDYVCEKVDVDVESGDGEDDLSA